MDSEFWLNPEVDNHPCPTCGGRIESVRCEWIDEGWELGPETRTPPPSQMSVTPCGHVIHGYVMDSSGRCHDWRVDPDPDLPGALPADYRWNWANNMHWWPSGPTPERAHP